MQINHLPKLAVGELCLDLLEGAVQQRIVECYQDHVQFLAGKLERQGLSDTWTSWSKQHTSRCCQH